MLAPVFVPFDVKYAGRLDLRRLLPICRVLVLIAEHENTYVNAHQNWTPEKVNESPGNSHIRVLAEST